MSVIQLKRGAAGEVPPLLPGEPAIVGKNLYVADAEGVGVRMATGAELAGHAEDAVRHVTEAERTTWNVAADTSSGLAARSGRQLLKTYDLVMKGGFW